MKQVSAAGVFGALLMLVAACGDDTREPVRDAGAKHLDAGEKPAAEPDVHALLVTAVIEIERTLLARCACNVERGIYENMRECVQKVSLGRDWVDCANAADLSALDDVQARANLRCTIAELSQRSECLMGSACTDQAVATCMSQSLGCPMLPLDPLSHVAVECNIAFSH